MIQNGSAGSPGFRPLQIQNLVVLDSVDLAALEDHGLFQIGEVRLRLVYQVLGQVLDFDGVLRYLLRCVFDHQLVAQFEGVIICRVFEYQRQDPAVDQVGSVDSCKGFGQHELHTQVQRC